ncbi:hypothetical protein [Caminibacter sp.]
MLNEKDIINAIIDAEAFAEEINILSDKMIELANRYDYDEVELAESILKIIKEKNVK